MIEKSAILEFPSQLIDSPIISHIIRKSDVEVNILQAYITPKQAGHMFVIFRGEEDAIDQSIKYLEEKQVKVVLPIQNLMWEEGNCVHCTACVGQ